MLKAGRQEARAPDRASSYRDNYARLVEIKRRYDPANVFRMNQNIRRDPE